MLRCEWKHRKYQCFLRRWLKNTVNYSVFGHLTLENHGICSGFCFSPRKNTVNNSNFAVFSCFSLFFELCWSAIHGYQILRVFFFPTISTFGWFWSQWPTSLAVTSGCPTMRCGRLPSRSDVNIWEKPFEKPDRSLFSTIFPDRCPNSSKLCKQKMPKIKFLYNGTAKV